jgi:hypothetical protein
LYSLRSTALQTKARPRAFVVSDDAQPQRRFAAMRLRSSRL